MYFLKTKHLCFGCLDGRGGFCSPPLYTGGLCSFSHIPAMASVEGATRRWCRCNFLCGRVLRSIFWLWSFSPTSPATMTSYPWSSNETTLSSMFRESSTPRKKATRIQSKMVNQERKSESSRTAMAIVLVKLLNWWKGSQTPAIIYAFLDLVITGIPVVAQS